MIKKYFLNCIKKNYCLTIICTVSVYSHCLVRVLIILPGKSFSWAALYIKMLQKLNKFVVINIKNISIYILTENKIKQAIVEFIDSDNYLI